MSRLYEMVGINYKKALDYRFSDVLYILGQTEHKSIAYMVWEDIKQRIKERVQ